MIFILEETVLCCYSNYLYLSLFCSWKVKCTWREISNSYFSQLFWDKIILAITEPKLSWALATVWNACTGPSRNSYSPKGQLLSIAISHTVSATQECCTLAVLYWCLFHALIHCGPQSACLKIGFTTAQEQSCYAHVCDQLEDVSGTGFNNC